MAAEQVEQVVMLHVHLQPRQQVLVELVQIYRQLFQEVLIVEFMQVGDQEEQMLLVEVELLQLPEVEVQVENLLME